MRAETSQILLIISGVMVATLFGVFLYREVFPEYKIYQNDYIALEEFRSTYTHEPAPFFQTGVKQIVIEREDRGPATIDRCTSCHVALQIPYFSPTKIAHDLNGNIVRDQNGHPLSVPNENYIWQKLDQKIAGLRDEKVIEQLKKEGHTAEIDQRLAQAAQYESLKVAHVGEQVYDVTKVLSMHPLMGNETYPFQYHPLEQYGCTSCHNGNGRGLVTDKAHGPVFDGQYAAEEGGHTMYWTEPDPKNDPAFARVFNHKPGEELIFQTEPLYVGALIQAKCVQCHQNSTGKLFEANSSVSDLALMRQQRVKILSTAYQNEKKSTLDLLNLYQTVQKDGYVQTLNQLKEKENDYSLPALELEHLASQIKYLEQAVPKGADQERAKAKIIAHIQQGLIDLLGSSELVDQLIAAFQSQGEEGVDAFLKEAQQDPQATGILFAKGAALDLNQDLMRHAQEAQESFSKSVNDPKLMSALSSDVDELTRDFQRGKELYVSQACYACHRIAGFSRGGVGPELTRSGENYPWYLKRKLVWPQGDLPTSTMPNMHFDTQELEHLMTFLLSQKGNNRGIAKTSYQAALQAWEAGRKVEWEKPISPTQMYDLRYAMTIFATQGCAACHRLQGYDSNVGFAVEKESSDFDKLYEQQQWFRKLFPEVVHYTYYDEELPGSEIVAAIENNIQEIDTRIVDNVRQDSILEEINAQHPETLESLYSPFRYASRAKDHHFQTLIKERQDVQEIAQLKKEWQQWKSRVHRVLMVYIQTYGLGRLIGPHLNWSGIYRSDEWLMEHFYNPPAHVPRSLMPVFPFDESKFYALTHMLDVLAVRNRQALRQIWDHRGFDPSQAYDMLCSQCHGIGRVGNGVIAEWIYPIPKNLHNPEFLRNLTMNEAIESIKHGVKGTPMPPWGEAAADKTASVQKISHGIPVLKDAEINNLVDWMFTGLSGGQVIRQATDVPKWLYKPEDVLKELEREGGVLIPLSPQEQKGKELENEQLPEKELPKENNAPPTIDKSLSFLNITPHVYYAALNPKISLEPVKITPQPASQVGDIFEIIPNAGDPDQPNYYIKKKFYTPFNLKQGQDFFLLNCAVCHGNEADGSGTRSQAMQEAKPRMLTNLDWINSRDDLRLLRSIKYGVPGTSMTPWGDLTSSLQRLQLVMFIRSLTKEKEQRSLLSEALYRAFENAHLTIEKARIAENEQMEKLQQTAQMLRTTQENLRREIIQGKENPQSALDVYQQSLEVEQKINALNKQDKMLNLLKSKLKAERDLYSNLGISLLGKDLPDAELQKYFDLILLNRSRYTFQDQQLAIDQGEKINTQIRELRQSMVKELDQKIAGLEKQRTIIEGKIVSAKQREELTTNQAEIEAYKKIKAKMINDIEAALRLADEQERMLNQNLN